MRLTLSVGLAVLAACSGQGGTINGSPAGSNDRRDASVAGDLQGAAYARDVSVVGDLPAVEGQGAVDLPADAPADHGDALAAEAGANVARPICSSDGWCWESLLPQGNDVEAMWASAANDIWVAPRPGPILHWDGATWTSFTLRSGKADTFVSSMWGSGPNNLWAVGTAVMHWDGVAWTAVDLPTSAVFASVWGSSASDVWTVGSSGAVAHFDGRAWSMVDAGSGAGLVTVWAAGPNEVWASGSNTLLHFDGQTWTEVWSPPSPGSWSQGRSLRTLAGTSATDIWGVTDGGYLMHYDGAAWSYVTDSTTRSVEVIRAIAADDVWFFGVGIDHWDGHTWTRQSEAATMLAGWVVGKNWAVAGGTSGRMVVWDGRAWTQMGRQITPSGYCLGITSLWASASDDAWAVGGWGMIFHSDGQGWKVKKSECESGKDERFASVSGSAQDNAWTVGVNGWGTGIAYRWDGSAWQEMALPPSTLSLAAVWTTGPGDVWAVGDSDCLHFDGSAWSRFDVGGASDPVTGVPQLRALWGSGLDDLWAVGARNLVAHWDGTKWTASVVSAAAGFDFDAVWGTSRNDVWVSGESASGGTGIIVHWDGSVWRAVLPASARSVSGIWGASPTDVWTTSCDGSCWLDHWDGTAWHETFEHRENFAAKVFGLASTGDVWAFGEAMILHRRP